MQIIAAIVLLSLAVTAFWALAWKTRKAEAQGAMNWFLTLVGNIPDRWLIWGGIGLMLLAGILFMVP